MKPDDMTSAEIKIALANIRRQLESIEDEAKEMRRQIDTLKKNALSLQTLASVHNRTLYNRGV